MPSPRLSAAMRRLTAARDKRRRAALGPVLSLNDAALTALADVSERDLPLVEAFVRDAAGERGVDMLRARRG